MRHEHGDVNSRPKIPWCDLVIGGAALWLLAAPQVLGYDTVHLPNMRAPAVNSQAVGIGLLLFGIISAWRTQDIGNEMLNIAFGCWLVLSPFALGFADLPRAVMNTIAVGLVVISLAIDELTTSL